MFWLNPSRKPHWPALLRTPRSAPCRGARDATNQSTERFLQQPGCQSGCFPQAITRASPQPSGEMSRTPAQTAPPPHFSSFQAPATLQMSVQVSSVAIIGHPSNPLPTGNSEEPKNKWILRSLLKEKILA